MGVDKKPLIGILPLYDSSKQSIWMFPGYTDGITKAGGIPVILSILNSNEDIEAIADRLDGFVFSGGQDVDPQYYGEPLLRYSNEIYPPRDQLELQLLRAVMDRDKPIFGVCRGLQLINVALGGSLYQDIDVQVKREFQIQHFQQNNYEHPVHSVKLKKESRLFEIYETETIRVNSMHHQGIARLAFDLQATAISEDGLVEAVEIGDLTFGLAVQWHPEFLWQQDEKTLSMLKAFVDAAKNEMKE
ncbi:MAG: putative glutamine amidotransferase [Acetobacterium sp.]|uniref:gamma-glutamyl-gamma-aminobutyrate hydrolase family protein n=1 Tax=Acetobacterium sp. K1/6 TaxID=3055467 RepID=UPI0029E1CD1C|nr:gamma-glutamyl-gamma-aminobutyrate hydrolase family protein [Acetobacterium sp. K1/6]MDK2940806.1 putative glutamine amidotransferase [Acetobacterium sp.]MDZ5725079.1 gamma-glutamyl-gamma-aminobutyrate hydrolase family protein [Acetobacterium sp. K1/6]